MTLDCPKGYFVLTVVTQTFKHNAITTKPVVTCPQSKLAAKKAAFDNETTDRMCERNDVRPRGGVPAVSGVNLVAVSGRESNDWSHKWYLVERGPICIKLIAGAPCGEGSERDPRSAGSEEGVNQPSPGGDIGQ